MGDAYTPGLTVTGATVVRKTRRLPLPGEVLVALGAVVRAEDAVARTLLPGKVNLLNLANLLGVLPDELAGAMKMRAGDAIRSGAVVAENRSFFGLFRSTVRSPVDGTFESVSSITGQAVLREPPIPVEVTAYLDGEVVEVIPTEGVVIEAHAAMVQGIFGLSGEVQAPLCMVARAPDETLGADRIDESLRGKIAIGGARVTLEAMRRARELGVAAVVAGGFAYQDVKDLLGYDVGVAVTGTEQLGTTLVVTEGFGNIAMARATFELLGRHDGDRASVNGATQIRAGVIRPEVIIPLDQRKGAIDGVAAHLGLDVGVAVRCIRAPHFGKIGTVTALPVDLETMPSETKVRVLEVRFEGGERATIPRANVEVIER